MSSQDKQNDRNFQKYVLKKVGKHWLLECNGKLKRLTFLTDARDVFIDENVLFAGGDLYQITQNDANIVEVTKIEDIYHKTSNELPMNISNQGSDDAKPNTWCHEHGAIASDFEACEGIIDEKRTTDYESMSDMVSTVDPICNGSDEVDKDKKFEKFLKRLSKFFDRKEVPTKTSDGARGPRTRMKTTVKTEQNQQKSQEFAKFLNAKSVEKFHEETDVVQVVALFSYEALHDDDISFEKGDKFEMNKEIIGQCFEWCIAKHHVTGEEGYVPRHYVTEDDNSPYTQDWYYNIRRPEADRLLGSPHVPVGTFIVRGDFSFLLSVKLNEGDVKHYKIRRLDNGRFYISSRKTFDSVLDLVSYYKNDANGLPCKLTEPYPKKTPCVHLRKLEVERHSVELLEQIRGGTGHYGDRHVGKFRKTLDVAVKRLKPNLLEMPADDFVTGMKMINKLRHDKLVQVLAICATTEPILIVSEFVPNGSLLDYLRREDVRASLRLEELIDIAAQIAEGMAYLEENKFVHGDLRVAKYLVEDRNEVKVADHGLFQLVEKDLSETNIRQLSNWLPTKWFAPEVLLSGSVSTKSDVWSYGVLLFEIITFGHVPYPGQDGWEVLDCVIKGYRMPKPNSGRVECPDPYYEIMLQCWNKSPERRPTFAYLQCFFEDYTVATEPHVVNVVP
ncbi:tyrosine-protein kinase SRK2-like [Mercenaria mercenaria]|uniref:tyrosine-protein kinase SRK2-like n=1 Tax=Mercenaria mercenaria TaxID=6596 RepID=UPI00234F263B|nr:tyrosine-protein kinase SRK2-like [Mercenaria mercenaria]